MDTILVVITGLALAIAAAMGVILVRTLRLERRRSDARVALLEELAAARPVSARAVAGPEIFEEHDEPSAWPRRFAVIGVLAALLCGVFIGWRSLGPAGPVSSASSQPAAQAPGRPGSDATAAAQPLELLSLQHAQQDGAMVISGLVQNPRGSAPLVGVQATVVLMAADGGTLASSRAAIDFTTLAPGDESPFVIRVPAAGGVARYRVGFRGANDRVLGHVDRRNNETVARKQAP